MSDAKVESKKYLLFSVLITATIVVVSYVFYLFYVVPTEDIIAVDEQTERVEVEDFLGSILDYGVE